MEKFKQQRQTDTDQRIQAAFQVLLATTPLEKISVNRITTTAGINRATFYAHYPDKYALFDHMMRHTIEKRLHPDVIGDAPLTTGLPLILTAISNYLQTVKTHCPYSYQELFPLIKRLCLPSLHDLLSPTKPVTFHQQLQAELIYTACALNVLEDRNLTTKQLVGTLTPMLLTP